MISKILFIHTDSKFIKWIKYYFKGIDGIHAKKIRVENYKPEGGERVAYMSPMNNMGMMDSGIDMAYTYVMFKHINTTIKKRVIEQAGFLRSKGYKLPPEMLHGVPYLSVGSAILVPIEETSHYLLGAPTLSYNATYSDSSKNAYYAFKAAFKLTNYYLNMFGENKINTLVVPALCCGSSGIDPKESAREIFSAYFDCVMGFDTDKPMYISPSLYVFKTNDYITYEKLLKMNSKFAKELGVEMKN